MSSELAGLPARLGRYELLRVLGRGGMGRVVLARDPVLRREVALKLVEPSAVRDGGLAEVRFLFHREARATAALKHPNIIEVYDYSGPGAELPFLACERIEGPTLRDLLEERGSLSAPLAAAVGHEIAQALGHAHSAGIVHRDLKPENIFWLSSGRIVLADFGIAKAVASGALGNTVQFGETSVYGSPAYMAPEQLGCDPVDGRADLHALGALLYEMLAGKQAFDGPTIEAILTAVQAEDRPQLPAEVAAPQRLVALIDRLLQKSPERRPPDAAAVGRALRQVLDALGVTDPRTWLSDFGEGPSAAPSQAVTALLPTPGAATSKRRRWLTPALWGISLCVIGGAMVVAALFVSSRPEKNAALTPVLQSPAETIVLIRFPGRATVWVDGRELGTVQDEARFPLAPGPHHLELKGSAGSVSRDVLLLPGTSPVFDLVPPVPADPSER